MSEAVQRNEGPAIGALHEVRAAFDDPDAMQEAVAPLEMAGFDRADLSLPEALLPAERATPERAPGRWTPRRIAPTVSAQMPSYG